MSNMTSSINEEKSYKLAAKGSQQRAAMKAQYISDHSNDKEQIVNARKGANVALNKAKAKKKAKQAKASRKKNK